MTEEKRDYRQDVTNDIIRLLESGTAPWQKPWKAGECAQLPYNPTSNKPYRGGNVLNLMIAAMRKGYEDPRWCTYKQAADNGWQVRKGEKASQIEFWDVRGPRKDDGESDADTPRASFIHRVYSVFNAAQIEGIPVIVLEPRQPFQVIEAGERILADSGADIRYGGSRAFYTPSADFIRLPHKENFIDAPAFYATAAHELGHWTGHTSRLNRETLMKSKGFDQHDENYAREELCAELASLYMSAETGLPHNPDQHAAYIGSWLQALKKDKNEIFRAASAASAAADYVLGKGRAIAQEPLGEHTQRVLESRGAVQLAR